MIKIDIEKAESVYKSMVEDRDRKARELGSDHGLPTNDDIRIAVLEGAQMHEIKKHN